MHKNVMVRKVTNWVQIYIGGYRTWLLCWKNGEGPKGQTIA